MKDYTHYICPICGKSVDKGHTKYHFSKLHRMEIDSRDYFRYYHACANHFVKHIDKNILLDVFGRQYDVYGCNDHYAVQFASFYSMVTSVREYDAENDNENYVKNVLPWKLKNHRIGNSRELCDLVFPNDSELAKKLYGKYMFEKNPFTGHGGELSVMSKDFIGYRGLTETEKEERIKKLMSFDRTGMFPNQIEYWLKRGLTKEQAIKMVHERQQTFSKEKCIKKYGYDEGMKRWKERQEKWQNTLNSKTEDEKKLILVRRLKNSRVETPFSKIEHEFSSQIVDSEHMNVCVTSYAVADICVGNKIIEFYGDYYHCNPSLYEGDYYNHDLGRTAKEMWEHDAIRTKRLESDGFAVKIVWEMDYKRDKEKVISECRKFIEG